MSIQKMDSKNSLLVWVQCAQEAYAIYRQLVVHGCGCPEEPPYVALSFGMLRATLILKVVCFGLVGGLGVVVPFLLPFNLSSPRNCMEQDGYAL